jgi:multidrug resistance efflux pump
MLDHRSGLGSLEESNSPPVVRKFGRISIIVLVVTGLLALILPWQQFVRGSGRVVAFNPLERPQVLEAPLSGRLIRSNVVEGQTVQAGEILFEMADNDPNRLVNLETQFLAAQAQQEAANEKVVQMRDQLFQKREAFPQAVAAAQQKLDAARFSAQTAELQFERIRRLYENPLGGLASQREFELATLDRDRTAAALLQAEADLEKVRLDGRADIAKAQADLATAQADSASKAQSVASYRSTLDQTRTLVVRAPRDGTIFRVDATEGTFLSAGKPLATIVPDTDQRMVELWMDGNDVPLVQARDTAADGTVLSRGDPVRLQFEGWPAVQFIGWPSVARGTFGGEVVLVDPTDDGTGRFRVLVAPLPDTVAGGEVVDWPGARWLRQGVQVNGWVLLRRVPLWYEIWRQLNGFPPALSESPGGSSMSGGK